MAQKTIIEPQKVQNNIIKMWKIFQKNILPKNTLMFNFYQYPLEKTKFTGVSKNSTKIVTCLFAYAPYCFVVQFATDMMPFDGKILIAQKWVFLSCKNSSKFAPKFPKEG